MTTRLNMLWTLALMVAFALASGYHLGNFFPISSDEVEIMSASYKLATEGRYASDLLVGFAQADEHFFMNLPVINLLQAATFKVFGAGLWQARLPSVASGVGLIAMVGWLAYRWGGLLVSVVATLLLVFWRTNLIGSEPRPPLLALAQSARYDLAVVAIVWMAIVFLNRAVERPSLRLGIAVGACAGVATLTQFYGIGVVLVIAAAYGRRWGRRTLTHSIPYVTGGAFLAVPAALRGVYRHALGRFHRPGLTPSRPGQFPEPDLLSDEPRCRAESLSEHHRRSVRLRRGPYDDTAGCMGADPVCHAGDCPSGGRAP